MEITEETIRVRLAELKKLRSDFAQQANLTAAKLDGAIAAYQELLVMARKEAQADE